MSQKLALGDIFKVTQNRVLILGSETPWLDSRGLRWPTMLFHDTKWRPKQLLQKVLSDLRKVTTQMLNRRVLINRLKLWSASPQRWLTLPTKQSWKTCTRGRGRASFLSLPGSSNLAPFSEFSLAGICAFSWGKFLQRNSNWTFIRLIDWQEHQWMWRSWNVADPELNYNVSCAIFNHLTGHPLPISVVDPDPVIKQTKKPKLLEVC